MVRYGFFLFLLALSVGSVVAAPVVTLPDNGVYYYWVRGASGTVQHSPRKSDGEGTITLNSHGATGGTLFILDSHTGAIAEVPLSASSNSIAVSIDQFHLPGTSTSSTTVAPASTPAVATQPAANQPAAPAPPSLLSRSVTFLFGVVVLVGVAWLVRLLLATKGQPLIDIARKVGVDVPNPDDLPPSSVTKEGHYEPPPVVRVQPVPEEAIKPAEQEWSAGYLTTQDGTAYEVGRKPLVIGRDGECDIVLADTSVSRRHARVEPSGGTAEIYDEGSANGVFVNGERIDRHVLVPGDRLHIGRVPIRYER